MVISGIWNTIVRYSRCQYVAGILAHVAIVSTGMHNGWTSPYIPALVKGNYTFQITSKESFYLVGIRQIGQIAGAIMILLIVDIVGRKKLIISSAVLFIIVWVALGLASSLLVMVVSRFLAGVSCIIIYQVVPMYLAEITEPRARGILLASAGTSLAIGELFIYLIGDFLPLDTAAFICTSLPAFYLLWFFWMPETPYFYLMQRTDDRAKESLRILRARKDVSKEFDRVSAAVKVQNESKRYFLDLFFVKSQRRALIICLGLRAFTILTGKDVMKFYCQTTFEQSTGIVSANTGSIMYILLHVVLSALSAFIVQFCKRKWLSIFSLTGTCICLTVYAFCLYYMDRTVKDLTYFSYLPVVLLLCYVIFFSIGMQAAPILLLSEIFPTNVKAAALFIMTIFTDSLIAVVSLFFHWSMDTFGLHVPFFVFAGCSGIGIVFFAVYVPETKGKTLEQIQLEMGMGEKQRVEFQEVNKDCWAI